MSAEDPIRSLLAERGCPEHVIAGGFEGLVRDWERVVGEVEAGYALGLDDYLNDLDARQLLEEVSGLAPAAEGEAALPLIVAADARMMDLLEPISECLWGEEVAGAEGWTRERNWWYFGLPRSPGAQLREDLAAE